MPGLRRLLASILGLVLLVSTVGASADAGKRALQSEVIHPALQSLMQRNPSQMVSVIVQKTGPQARSEDLARSSGGQVEAEFAFITSFKMTVPVKTLQGLARNPNVRYITPDSKMVHHAVDTSNLLPAYPTVTGAVSLWNQGTGLTGAGVTVAVIDSGVAAHADFGTRIALRWAAQSANQTDLSGHGTHVAGTIAGRGQDGRYIGVAPGASIVALKTANDKYVTSESNVVKALEWVYLNHKQYNIRIVNMSISSAMATSYTASPLAAAAERVWQSGVVVVVSSGNRGPGPGVLWYPPANDPFVITVGALDDNQTIDTLDDSLSPFSSFGLTQENMSKPEVVAPGRRIYAPLASKTAALAKLFPDRVTTDGNYIRLSGTSMATPVVSGLIALLLEAHPDLTPDQVKWALTATAAPYANQPTGTGGKVEVEQSLALIDAYKASGQELGSANTGVVWNPQADPTLVEGSSGTYDDTAYWDTAYWDTAYWDTAYWDTAYWDTSADGEAYLEDAATLEWD